jgi:cystathionine gamma-synthase
LIALSKMAGLEVSRSPSTHRRSAPGSPRRAGPGDVVLAFEVADAPTADRLCNALHIIVHATSLGGVESTIERRGKLPGQEHVPPWLLRLSVGCEHIDDLWNDLNSALQHASRPDNPGPGPGRAERR